MPGDSRAHSAAGFPPLPPSPRGGAKDPSQNLSNGNTGGASPRYRPRPLRNPVIVLRSPAQQAGGPAHRLVPVLAAAGGTGDWLARASSTRVLGRSLAAIWSTTYTGRIMPCISRAVFRAGWMPLLAPVSSEEDGRPCDRKRSERYANQRRLQRDRLGTSACAPCGASALRQQSGPSYANLQQLFGRADFGTRVTLILDNPPYHDAGIVVSEIPSTRATPATIRQVSSAGRPLPARYSW